MSNIKLLDCTLRDGAYITNGNFGSGVIKGIIKNLSNANSNVFIRLVGTKLSSCVSVQIIVGYFSL